MIVSNHILLIQLRQGFSRFLRINCFNLSSTPCLYLTSTRMAMMTLITDWRTSIALLLLSANCKKESRRESKMEVKAKLVINSLLNCSCSWMNLVRCESSNCLSSQTSSLGREAASNMSQGVSPCSKQAELALANLFLSLSLSHFEKASFLNLVTGSNSSMQLLQYQQMGSIEQLFIIRVAHGKKLQMTSRDINTSNPRKSSAFNPVLKDHPDPPQLFIPSPQHAHRSEVIFESEEQPLPERNPPSEEYPSEDYYCMTCHQNFNIRISPCNHRMDKYPRFKCDYDDCNREFNIGSGLERHKLVHTGAKPYECDFDRCEQRFNQKSNLNRHRRIHTQEKPFICEKCCKSFTTTTNLKQHVQVHFEDKEKRKRYVCEIKGCNKQYLYMCNLKKHKQEHEDPLSECIGEKKPDFPAFGLTIGNCSFRILHKRNKDHSEVLVTFRDVEEAMQYKPEHFAKVLEAINSSEQKGEMGSCMEEMEMAMDRLFETSKNAVNICFEVHPDLSPVANLLVKASISMIGALGAKVFTILLPSYAIFRDVIQNLLNDFQPQEEE